MMAVPLVVMTSPKLTLVSSLWDAKMANPFTLLNKIGSTPLERSLQAQRSDNKKRYRVDESKFTEFFRFLSTSEKKFQTDHQATL